MKKNKSSNNKTKKGNDYSISKSNYNYPAQNKNQIQNQYSINTNNSINFNFPFSHEITNQYQLNNSYGRNIFNTNTNNDNVNNYSYFNNTYTSLDDISKSFSKTIPNDSKVLKIKKITKKSMMPSNNNANITDKPKKNIMNLNNIINNDRNKNDNNMSGNDKSKNKKIEIDSNSEDSDDESGDYGNAEDDDFDNILRESINIRNTQQKLNLNNNNINQNKPEQNPFLKQNQNIVNNNIIEDKTENKVYNDMNNQFNKVIFESGKKDTKIQSQKNEDLKIHSENFYQQKNIANNNTFSYNFIDNKQDTIFSNYFYNIKNDNNENIINPDAGNNYENIYNKNNNIGKNSSSYNSLSSDNNNNNNNNNMIPTIIPETNYTKLDFNNPETKIQFINHNISIDNMLKEINFLEKLKSISNSRYSYFVEKYQKDNYFMEKEQFENIFIDEKRINVHSPLTLIFHHIFNPETHRPESDKNFFETIFTKRGDKNYTMTYDTYDLSTVPRYFDDFTYVNKLFNNFNEKDFNSFLEEIKTWKETFTFEQQFIHPLYMFRREKSITMKDVAKVYFISPYDLIIDYHSYGSDLPLSDTFIAITQYRFHCDINFDCKNGKFIFKTSGKIFNTIKIVKETLLKNTIRNESNSTNKAELQINTWPPLKSVIESEDEKNQKIVEKIYKNYLMNNLNKYSKELPKNLSKEYIDKFYRSDEDKGQKKSEAENKSQRVNENKKNILDNKINNMENNDDGDYKNDWKKELEEKNMIILKYVVIFIIFILVMKIFWSFFSGNISFRSIFNSFLVLLLGYVLIKFNLLKI